MTYSRTKRWQAELKQVLGSEQWHCPAGCKLGASECARARFRLQCLPTRLQLLSTQGNQDRRGARRLSKPVERQRCAEHLWHPIVRPVVDKRVYLGEQQHNIYPTVMAMVTILATAMAAATAMVTATVTATATAMAMALAMVTPQLLTADLICRRERVGRRLFVPGARTRLRSRH